jgi:predicted 2-oxoglutarate/Fe(II)-dependent dioxygenase YbiX
MPNADFFALFRLFVRRNFLPAELCTEIRSEMRSASGSAATVRKTGGDYVVDPAVRRAKWVEVSAATVALMETRLLSLKPQLEEHFHLKLAGCQRPQFLAYRQGDFYAPHRDNSKDPQAAEIPKQRRVSVVIFLNSESGEPADGSYAGGSLTFYGLLHDPQKGAVGLPLVGETGLLIAFQSSLVHAVAPVTYGERYTIAGWFF